MYTLVLLNNRKVPRWGSKRNPRDPRHSPESQHSWYMWTNVCGKSQFESQHLKGFQWRTGSGEIPLLWRAEHFQLRFYHESKARSALPKSCWTRLRIRCLDRKFLQYGSGLGRRGAENPSEILTPLALIDNILFLQLNKGFVQISVYFPTSGSAQLLSGSWHRFKDKLCLLTWGGLILHSVSASGHHQVLANWGKSLSKNAIIFWSGPGLFWQCSFPNVHSWKAQS